MQIREEMLFNQDVYIDPPHSTSTKIDTLNKIYHEYNQMRTSFEPELAQYIFHQLHTLSIDEIKVTGIDERNKILSAEDAFYNGSKYDGFYKRANHALFLFIKKVLENNPNIKPEVTDALIDFLNYQNDVHTDYNEIGELAKKIDMSWLLNFIKALPKKVPSSGLSSLARLSIVAGGAATPAAAVAREDTATRRAPSSAHMPSQS